MSPKLVRNAGARPPINRQNSPAMRTGLKPIFTPDINPKIKDVIIVARNGKVDTRSTVV